MVLLKQKGNAKMITRELQIGWGEEGSEQEGEPKMFAFPCNREPVTCDHCRGEGKTVADNLRGLDFSAEELQRNGDWDDYVSHEGIWQWHKCSRCSGHGCYMEDVIDWKLAEEKYPEQVEAHHEHENEMSEMRRVDELVRRGESGGYC